MEVEIKISPELKNPKVVIYADRITDGITKLAKMIASEQLDLLTGVQDGKLIILRPEEIIRIYTEGQKVFANTGSGTVEFRQRLYELENRLPRKFLRVSHSEIVNVDAVKYLDMSLAGTIRLSLSSGETAYVSRRNIRKIREYLNL